MLKYEKITFNQSGSSRFTAQIEPREGWVQIYNIPKTLSLASVSVLNSESVWSISKKIMSNPYYLQVVEVEQNGKIYKGKLIQLSENSITILQPNDIKIQVTNPFALKYDEKSTFLELFFVKKTFTTRPQKLTFTAEGFSWSASYRANIDFKTNKISIFECNIQLANNTDFSLENVSVDLVSKSEPESFMRQVAMAAPRSQSVRSEQTSIGTSIFKFPQMIDLPGKMVTSEILGKVEMLKCEIKLKFGITEGKNHPNTIVTFKVPENFKDGIPSGSVECWENEVWLADTYLPMTGPNETVKLNLGENGLVDVDSVIETNQVREKEDNEESQRTKYSVKVTIRNNSEKEIKLFPFQDYYQKIDVINHSVPFNLENTKRNSSITFDLPPIKTGQSFQFSYEIIS